MSTYEEAKYFVDCINDLNDISRKHLLLIDNKKESFTRINKISKIIIYPILNYF